MSKDKIDQWKEQMSYLESIIFDADKFEESVSLLTHLHTMVHSSDICPFDILTIDDDLWSDMDEFSFRTIADGEKVTIAWSIYHISRIEDMTMNNLVVGDNQIFHEGNWNERLNCPITDTGNSLTTDEIHSLSSTLNMQELRNYRNFVGRKTNKIINELHYTDLSRTIREDSLQRIFNEGGVKEETRWLLDFWGSKSVAGLLYMPANFHNLHHLVGSIRMKEKCKNMLDSQRSRDLI